MKRSQLPQHLVRTLDLLLAAEEADWAELTWHRKPNKSDASAEMRGWEAAALAFVKAVRDEDQDITLVLETNLPGASDTFRTRMARFWDLACSNHPGFKALEEKLDCLVFWRGSKVALCKRLRGEDGVLLPHYRQSRPLTEHFRPEADWFTMSDDEVRAAIC